MAQEGVIRNFMVALGFKTDNTGLGQMQSAMEGVDWQAKALKASLLAMATGAIVAVRQTAGELDKLYYSSQRIGASVTNINAYGNAIAQLGGSAEGAIGSLESIAEKMRNSPGYESMIGGLGVATRDANGEMRDRVEMMKDLSGVLSKMPAYQANAYAESLGIDQNTLLAMRDGKFMSNMEKYQKIQKELGMNDDLAKSGNEFMAEYRDLTMMTKTGFQVLVMQAGKALIPILRLLNQLIQKGISAFSQLNPQVKDMLGMGLRFAMLALVMGGFIKTFGMIFKFIPMLKGFIGLLKLFRLAFLASPIGIILALAAAIGLLYDDYKTWRDGGKSLFDWSKWTEGIDFIIEKIQDFLDLLDKIKDKTIEFINKVINNPTEAFEDLVEGAKETAVSIGDALANPQPDENGHVSKPRDVIAEGMDAGFGLVDKGLAFFGNEDAQQRVKQREKGEIGYQNKPVENNRQRATDNKVQIEVKNQQQVKQNPEKQNSYQKSADSDKDDKPDIVKEITSFATNTAKAVEQAVKGGVGGATKYKFSFGQDVDKYIKEASVKYGIDEKILRGFVKMEAGWTGKMSPTGAIGTGQFIQSTWNGLAKTKDGKAIGMTKIDKSNFRKSNDPRHNKRVNTLATGLLAKQNADVLKKYGIPLTGENLYLAHNIGAVTFAKAFTGKGANEDGLLAMRQNGMKKGETPQQFVKRQRAIYMKHYNKANELTEQPTDVGAKSKNIPQLQTYAPPQSNPHKSQVNNSSNMSASNVTIHQSYKTDMVINGASSPVETANTVQRQQDNAMVIMARGTKGLLVG